MAIRIVPTTEEYIASFHSAVDSVARERRYLGFLAAPPIEQTVSFIRRLLADGGVQMLAVTDANQVVGWCDVTRVPWEGLRHVGRLGIGVLKEYRGQGYGRMLAERAIGAAHTAGMERIELEVFASNVPAIKLYEALGFVREGYKKGFRKLDGVYDDNVIMALLDVSASG
jgi:ribosomal protein S18 acetylase RimI-like enzyme